MKARTAVVGCVAILTLAGCYHERDYSPTAPQMAVLSLRTEPAGASIPADSLSRITIVASIDPRSTPRDVAFDTSAGTFVGGSGTSATSRTVTTDAKGEARILLQSGNVADKAIVAAHITGVSAAFAQISIAFTPVSGDSIIQFTAAPSAAPADGATVVTFVVSVPTAPSLSSRSVTFTTTAGAFLPDATSTMTTTLDSDGVARALLRSPNSVATGRVRATVGNAIAEAVILFQQALPDSVTVTSSTFALKQGFANSVTIAVQLRRQVGTVTPGAVVTLTATDAQGHPIGQFAAPTLVVTGADGRATSDYTAGNTTYVGPVNIHAGVGNTAVSGDTTIQVITP